MSRYERHIPLYSKEEFKLIQNARIAVAGIGGLGSTVLQLLVRIGIGTIHFWDDSILDEPDLNRQILYKTTHLGQLKTKVALQELKEINPDIKIVAHTKRLDINSNIPDIDLVIDCLDTFASRLVLDYLFFAKGIPIIHASIFEEMGQVTSLVPGKTQNYKTTFCIEDNQEEQKIKTVFPAIVTSIASIQVSETIKYISKQYNQMLLNKLLMINLKNNQFEILPLL